MRTYSYDEKYEMYQYNIDMAFTFTNDDAEEVAYLVVQSDNRAEWEDNIEDELRDYIDTEYCNGYNQLVPQVVIDNIAKRVANKLNEYKEN